MIRRSTRLLYIGLILFAAAPAAIAQTASDVVCTGCVDATDIRSRAVTRNKIQNEAVNPAKLAPNAKPAGGAHSESTGFFLLPDDNTFVVVRQVTVNAPAPGQAVVMATWYFVMQGDGFVAQCFIVPGGQGNSGPARFSQSNTAALFTDNASLVRMFPVAAGSNTFDMRCGAGQFQTPVSINAPTLTAIYVPQLL